jgi:hypothetical protein
LWEAETQREVACYEGREPIQSCFFSPDAEFLVSLSARGEVTLYAVTDINNRSGRATHLAVHCACLAPTGEQLVFGTEAGRLAFLPLGEMAERALCVTPVASHEPREGLFARLFGRPFRRVLSCRCPVCRHRFKLRDANPDLVGCPKCRRPLRINRFTLPA